MHEVEHDVGDLERLRALERVPAADEMITTIAARRQQQQRTIAFVAFDDALRRFGRSR